MPHSPNSPQHDPEHDYDDEFEDGVEGEDEEGDEDDEPTAVFVSITPGKDADEVGRTIAKVCERLGLEAQRLPNRGNPEILRDLIDTSDFAILDVSAKRQSLALELDMLTRELSPEFYLLIAKAGALPANHPPELEGRAITTYSDMGDLRVLIERTLNTMIDAWHEGGMA